MIRSSSSFCIAVCGLKRSGKDSISSYIENKLGYQHVKISSKLKDTVRDLFQLTHDEVETDLKDRVHSRWGIEPRRLLQFFGTEVFQFQLQTLIPNVGRTFWVQNVMETCKKKKYTNIVISDLRFPHELEVIRQFYDQVFVIRVNRPGLEFQDGHCSEQEHILLREDAVINNVGSLKDLYDRVDSILLKRHN
jgi:hypothetical protein